MRDDDWGAFVPALRAEWSQQRRKQLCRTMYEAQGAPRSVLHALVHEMEEILMRMAVPLD